MMHGYMRAFGLNAAELRQVLTTNPAYICGDS